MMGDKASGWSRIAVVGPGVAVMIAAALLYRLAQPHPEWWDVNTRLRLAFQVLTGSLPQFQHSLGWVFVGLFILFLILLHPIKPGVFTGIISSFGLLLWLLMGLSVSSIGV